MRIPRKYNAIFLLLVSDSSRFEVSSNLKWDLCKRMTLWSKCEFISQTTNNVKNTNILNKIFLKQIIMCCQKLTNVDKRTIFQLVRKMYALSSLSG